MNKKEKNIASIGLLMICPLLFGFVNTIWFFDLTPIVKKDLSDSQIEEICVLLKFELVNDEHIYLEYNQGALQAVPLLNVYIENVKSEEDFLARFDGITKSGGNSTYNAYINGTSSIRNYDIDIFKLERRPKDYMCGLAFFYEFEDDCYTVMFYISGYISDLDPIYDYFFYYDNIKPFLRNWMFMIPLCIELTLIGYLAVTGCTRLIKKA